MKDRTDRLFEAIENPDRFSDMEIQEILADSDMQELYKQICKTADTLTSTEEPDIEREWTLFVNSQNRSAIPGFIKTVRVFFNRNVAAVLLCTVASLAVLAATLGVAYSFSHKEAPAEYAREIEEAPSMSETVTDTDKVEKSPSEERITVIFKDESFGSMISLIADFYGVSVVYKNEKSKNLRMYFQWDQNRPLNEIVEQLNNFKQIKMSVSDNTITIE